MIPNPNVRFVCEPQRKVHLNEELVAQTMSELYISHPRPKVARRYADMISAANEGHRRLGEVLQPQTY